MMELLNVILIYQGTSLSYCLNVLGFFSSQSQVWAMQIMIIIIIMIIMIKIIMMKKIIIIIIMIIKACFADDVKHFLNEHSKVLPKVRAYISFF